MAVQVIHIFKDGTVKDNLDGVVVPPEIVKSIYNIVKEGRKEKENG